MLEIKSTESSRGRELDSAVKRKTSTNLGSNRNKFNVNMTNIYSIQIPVV
jgi:hypothetical protein